MMLSKIGQSWKVRENSLRALVLASALLSFAPGLAARETCESILGASQTPRKLAPPSRLAQVLERVRVAVDVRRLHTDDPGPSPSLQRILQGLDLRDQYGNHWEVHPEDDYLRIVAGTASQPALLRIFQQTIAGLHSEHYGRRFKSAEDTKARTEMKFLKHVLLKSEEGEKAAYFHTELTVNSKTYMVLDLNLKTLLSGPVDHHDWWKLETYMTFLLKIYRERLGVNEEQAGMLGDITRRMIDRTTLIDATSVAEKSDNGYHRKIGHETGLILVESKDRSEEIPLGILHGIEIRDFLPPSPRQGVVELGRLGRGDGASAKTGELMQIALASVASRPHVEYVVIEVDAARKRAFGGMGFHEIDLPEHLRRGEFYKSGTDFLMYARVSDLIPVIFPDRAL